MTTTVYRLTVDQYERMIEAGILPESTLRARPHRGEGRKRPRAPDGRDRGRSWPSSGCCPRGGTPARRPPSGSRAGGASRSPTCPWRGAAFTDYTRRDPGPGDLALVVEVTRTTAAKDRRLAKDYGACGIPACWIVNLRRQLKLLVPRGRRPGA